MKGDAALAARGLRKVFATSAGELVVLDGLTLELKRGEMAAVVGPSGSGKTTLLYLLAGLDLPTAGEIEYDGERLEGMSREQLAAHRNRRIGFVWQLSNLLPEFTALENVAMPLLVRGEPRAAASREAVRWLEEVGLRERAGHLAGELSGGEQQRVALARALVTGPEVLFADEPTGNLDAATSEKILTLLAHLHRSHGLTSLWATHNLELAGRCNRVWRLEQGHLRAAAHPTAQGEATRDV